MKTSLFLLAFYCSAFFNNLINEKPKDHLINISRQDTGTLSKRGENIFADPLTVLKCKDFSLSGNGNNPEWDKAKWNYLTKLDTGGKSYESKFKILYSTTGIYLLFAGEDDKITTKLYNDFEDIFNGDVFEAFFHTNPQVPVYFEYEINQLNKELILTLSKLNGQISSWTPRNYRDGNDRSIKRRVNAAGGKTEVNGIISSWSAELFFPYSILGLLPNVPPSSGTIWNANFCRLDYDSGNMIKWSWSPAIQTSFHEIEKFRSIKFE